MKRLLTLLVVLGLCASATYAADRPREGLGGLGARLRQAVGAGGERRQDRPKTGRPARRSAKRPGKAVVTTTFAIHRNNPEWWRDPAAFTFEYTLREAVRFRMPQEAPALWLARNGAFRGSEVNWSMRLGNISRIDESTAGQEYYSSVSDVERQEAAVERLRQSARSGRDARPREGRPSRRRARTDRSRGQASTPTEGPSQLDTARQRLRQLTAQRDRWKMLLDEKGGMTLQVTFQERPEGADAATPVRSGRARRTRNSRRNSRNRRETAQAASAGKTIELTLTLVGEAARELDLYIEGKEAQYPRSSDDWPILIAGTIKSLRYDGARITMALEDSWKWTKTNGRGTTESDNPRRQRREGDPRTRDPMMDPRMDPMADPMGDPRMRDPMMGRPPAGRPPRRR